VTKPSTSTVGRTSPFFLITVPRNFSGMMRVRSGGAYESSDGLDRARGGAGRLRLGNLLAALYREVRGELAHFRGKESDTAGDGLFATFDGPARAIQCARSLVDATRTLGLELRAGVHTGECELHGDKVRGIAVHTGARVASLASPGEVLVSSTVKDLVAGSGIDFEDRGAHELKGVPGEWRLYAAR
jgi:class 3 adenylate cyclase